MCCLRATRCGCRLTLIYTYSLLNIVPEFPPSPKYSRDLATGHIDPQEGTEYTMPLRPNRICCTKKSRAIARRSFTDRHEELRIAALCDTEHIAQLAHRRSTYSFFPEAVDLRNSGTRRSQAARRSIDGSLAFHEEGIRLEKAASHQAVTSRERGHCGD